MVPIREVIAWLNRTDRDQPVVLVDATDIAGLVPPVHTNNWLDYSFVKQMQAATHPDDLLRVFRKAGIQWMIVNREKHKAPPGAPPDSIGVLASSCGQEEFSSGPYVALLLQPDRLSCAFAVHAPEQGLPAPSGEHVKPDGPAGALEKPGPGAGVYDDRDPRIVYTGTWLHGNGAQLYAGTETFSNSPTANATFTFNGTSVSYVHRMSTNIGLANVYIDGALVSPDLDGYLAPTGAAPNDVRQKLVTYSGLAPRNHTITISATGRNDGLATGS